MRTVSEIVKLLRDIGDSELFHAIDRTTAMDAAELLESQARSFAEEKRRASNAIINAHTKYEKRMKAELAAHTGYAEQLKRFIVAVKCPNPRCVDGSIQSTGPDPQDDACEWCYERHLLLNEWEKSEHNPTNYNGGSHSRHSTHNHAAHGDATDQVTLVQDGPRPDLSGEASTALPASASPHPIQPLGVVNHREAGFREDDKCSSCGNTAAGCWCPCPNCGLSTTTAPAAMESCQCSYELLALALKETRRTQLDSQGNVK